MANPVSPLASSIPFVTEPFVTDGGVIATDWYRFLVALWNRTGQGTGVTDSDATSQQALTEAATASAAASAATVTANSAESLALAANTASAAASAVAAQVTNSVSVINNSALFAVNNLSELASDSAARANLGLSNVPWWFSYGTFISGESRYLPIVQPTTIPTNFIGTAVWCGTAPSSAALFKVNCIRSGTTTNIGDFTIFGLNAISCTAQNAFQLRVGDVLQIVAPSPADSAMANVGITFMLQLT